MKKFNYTITDPQGIHARPAGILVKKAAEFASKITIDKDGKTADAKRMLNLMGLGIKCGETVTVFVEGDDEETASMDMEAFFKNTL